MNAQMIIPGTDGDIRVRSQSRRRFVIAVVDTNNKARIVKRSDNRDFIVQQAFANWQASGWVFNSVTGQIIRRPWGPSRDEAAR